MQGNPGKCPRESETGRVLSTVPLSAWSCIQLGQLGAVRALESSGAGAAAAAAPAPAPRRGLRGGAGTCGRGRAWAGAWHRGGPGRGRVAGAEPGAGAGPTLCTSLGSYFLLHRGEGLPVAPLALGTKSFHSFQHFLPLSSRNSGNSLAVQWLGLRAFTAKGPGSIPRLGTKMAQAQQPINE